MDTASRTRRTARANGAFTAAKDQNKKQDNRLRMAARTRLKPGEYWPLRGGVAILLILLNLIILQSQTVECDSSSSSIIITQFHVPSPAIAGDPVRLSCQYKLSGETFRALKLFKDDKEFYRYTPSSVADHGGGGGQLQATSTAEEDRIIVFPADGVTVDRARSNERDVWLKNVNKRAAGLYKCQVSVENTFKSASATKRMVVIDRPKNNQQLQQRHSLQQQQRQRQKHQQELQQQHQSRGNQMTSMPVSIQLESSQSSSSASSSLLPSFSSSYSSSRWLIGTTRRIEAALAPLSLFVMSALAAGSSVLIGQQQRFYMINAQVG